MNSEDRRGSIGKFLENAKSPIKGEEFSKNLGVTRQVIVKDIAILRASGINIIATPKGYILSDKTQNGIKSVIAVNHSAEEIQDELETIVKFGGIIEDVIIEHKLYGEIRGILMIKTMYDVQNFMEKLKKYKNEPLSILTGGVHLHTIIADDQVSLNNILAALKEKQYLISD
ncbi:MAG: transcription repressor NadR [Clostridium sp.]|nr:transcription repressor NadR [Clostridium sp.]